MPRKGVQNGRVNERIKNDKPLYRGVKRKYRRNRYNNGLGTKKEEPRPYDFCIG